MHFSSVRAGLARPVLVGFKPFRVIFDYTGG
jgi:hypothetical protein